MPTVEYDRFFSFKIDIEQVDKIIAWYEHRVLKTLVIQVNTGFSNIRSHLKHFALFEKLRKRYLSMKTFFHPQIALWPKYHNKIESSSSSVYKRCSFVSKREYLYVENIIRA